VVPKRSPELVRFGVFEVDFRSGEVRKQGRKVRLQDRPFQFLTVLLERPGQTITREELARRLWSEQSPIGVDNSLNLAAKKLRQALGDDAESPRFIETLPRRGYRFIGPVEALPTAEVWDIPPAFADAEPIAPRPSRRWWLALPAVIAFGLVAVLLLAPSHPPSVVRTVQLTHTGRAELYAAILTDGARIYFNERSGGTWSLAQVSVEGGIPTPVQAPRGVPELRAISPNRSELLVNIAVNNEEEAPLWIVPTAAGAPRRLGNVLAHAAVWSPDGRSIVYGLGRALYRMNNEGTDSRKIADTPGKPYFIRWSPSGQAGLLRFTVVDTFYSVWECSPEGSGLHPFRPASKAGTGASLGDIGADWTPDGKYFLFESLGERGLGVWAVREARDPFHLFERRSLPIYATPTEAGVTIPSMDGKRLFFAGGQESRELVSYDAQRNQFLPFLGGGALRSVDFSKDGQWVVYENIGDGVLWRSRADGSEPLQLTAPPLHVAEPQWSPDGQLIAFAAGQVGIAPKLYVAPSGGGTMEAVSTAPYQVARPSWSPDGQSLMFGCWRPEAMSESAAVCLLDWKTRQIVVLAGSQGLLRPALSPDGRYVAALGASGTQVVLYDMRTRQWTALASGGNYGIPFWTRDSRHIYFEQVLGDPDQPIFRASAATHAVERAMSSRQIPQSGFSGYTLTGLTPGGAPIATVLRTNGDLYALDVDLP